MKEIYKDVKGYEGIYQVSNTGRVKSLSRVILKCGRNPFLSKEIILKPTLTKDGYLKVDLCLNGKVVSKYVHVLVAMEFLNHVPDKRGFTVINHKNFVRHDNMITNLEIVSQRDNANKKHIKSSSEYVGVSWNKRAKKFSSKILVKRKFVHLGYFNDEYEAHIAYQNYLKKLKNEI